MIRSLIRKVLKGGIRKLLFALVVVSSLAFFNMTDCVRGIKLYVYHPSFTSGGAELHVVVRTANDGVPGGCYFNYDGEPDTTQIRCYAGDVAVFDTTVVFTDSTEVILDGRKGVCQALGGDFLDLNGVVESREFYVKTASNDTLNLRGGFQYFSGGERSCYDNEIYWAEFRFSLRSDSPYVWIRPLGYDSVFVSAETTAYLIEEPFPFVREDSFRLTHRRLVRLHLGDRYHYGAVELLPADSGGWAKLKVSLSVVPGLGWTLPPADSSL